MPWSLKDRNIFKNHESWSTTSPIFDRKKLHESVSLLLDFSPDFETLVENIEKITGTFLYPSSVISLLVFDDRKKSGTRVYNADLQVTRSIADWAIDKPDSIAHWMLYQSGASCLNFPAAPGFYCANFMALPADLAAIYALPTERTATLVRYLVT